MPALGFDCQVILDGTGIFVAPASYSMSRPKPVTAVKTRGTPAPVPGPTKPVVPSLPIPSGLTGGVPTRFVDRGPGLRVWKFDALCLNTLSRYDGTPLGPTGQATRDALQLSYEKVASQLAFVDPSGYTYSVLFTQLVEKIADLRTQLLGIDYILTCTLTEAA